MENPKKNILIFIDWFLPGTKSGGPVRSYANMLDHLSDYLNFHIITRNTDFCSDEVYEKVKSNSWNQFNENTSIYYFSKDKLSRKNIKNILRDLDFDLVYINGVYSWYFSILPLLILEKNIKIIIAARGMLNPHSLSVKGGKKKLYLWIAKLIGLYKNVIFHATNVEEKTAIETIFGNSLQIKIAPNFPRYVQSTYTERTKNRVTNFVNVSRISKEKGSLKMIQAFGYLSENVVLDIYGPIYDPSYWKRCQEAILLLPSNIVVNYKGSVESDEIPNILIKYDYFILLSEGENFGHAILEGLSAGCPVIISNKTPWKNLQEIGVGWDLDLNQTKKISETLLKACNTTVEDYKKMSKSAYEYAVEFYNDPQTLKLNKELFQ